MSTPEYREGLGDDPGRKLKLDHGYIEYRYAPGHTCEIVNIEVEAEHRGKGVGRELVTTLCKIVRQRAKHVYAVTRSSNLIAQEFYAKCGFHVVGVLNRFYDDELVVDAIMYGRRT